MGTQDLMERGPQNEGSALVPLKAAEFLTGTISREKCGKYPGQGQIPASWGQLFLYMITLINMILHKLSHKYITMSIPRKTAKSPSSIKMTLQHWHYPWHSAFAIEGEDINKTKMNKSYPKQSLDPEKQCRGSLRPLGILWFILILYESHVKNRAIDEWKEQGSCKDMNCQCLQQNCLPWTNFTYLISPNIFRAPLTCSSLFLSLSLGTNSFTVCNTTYLLWEMGAIGYIACINLLFF